MLQQTIVASLAVVMLAAPIMLTSADVDPIEEAVGRLSMAVRSLLENRDDPTLKATALNQMVSGVGPFVKDRLNHEGVQNLNIFLRDARVRWSTMIRNKTQVAPWSHDEILKKLATAREHFYPAIKEAYETGLFEPHLISIDGMPAYAYLADLAKQMQMLGFDMHKFFDAIESTLTALYDEKKPAPTTTAEP